jgi:hypothetical protein
VGEVDPAVVAGVVCRARPAAVAKMVATCKALLLAVAKMVATCKALLLVVTRVVICKTMASKVVDNNRLLRLRHQHPATTTNKGINTATNLKAYNCANDQA